MLFAAVRLVANGTKRRSAATQWHVAYWGHSGQPAAPGPDCYDAIDP